jgi:hypothetical protein
MPPTPADGQNNAWLFYALMTVATWGVYGVLLHMGQMNMQDPVNGRYKAFLFVGFAYMIVAIIAPFLMLVLTGANFRYPVPGMAWSLIAGIAGAVGAFGILLAFGVKNANGSMAVFPATVMTIVFAGAPVVNAIVSLLKDPPEGGWGKIEWPFWLGIVLAATGGALVTFAKPPPAKPHGPGAKPIAAAAAPAGQQAPAGTTTVSH